MTTCAKCGAENVAGDAFCGNCGAFLEFAAEEAAETSAPAAPAAGVEPGGVESAGGTPAGGETPPPGPPPAGPPPAVAAPGPAPTAEAGPTCAACGRANPAGRRFCISCGERLPGGATAGGPAVAGAAAAAAVTGGTAARAAPASSPAPAPSPATWEFPTAPTAAPAPATVPRTAPAAATGGRSRLPLVLGLLAILVVVGGGAVFLLGGGLGGGTPAATGGPGASSAVASGAPSGGPSAEPATAAPSGAPSAQPTGAPATIPPGPAVGVKVTSAKASSQLSAKRGAANLYDGSPASAWKSKTGAIERSWVEVTFAPAAVTRIQVWAGWQVDQPTYYGNHRPRNVTISFDGGDPVPLELKDALGAQRIDIPPELGIARATTVRITILDTYPSRKTSAGGSPTKEVAISEIRIFGIPVTP